MSEETELVPENEAETKFATALLETVNGGMQGLADAQKFAATETTKRTNLWVQAAKQWRTPITIVGVLFIGLLAVSIFKGNYDFPEKVITGLIGFAGGFVSRIAFEKKAS